MRTIAAALFVLAAGSASAQTACEVREFERYKEALRTSRSTMAVDYCAAVRAAKDKRLSAGERQTCLGELGKMREAAAKDGPFLQHVNDGCKGALKPR